MYPLKVENVRTEVVADPPALVKMEEILAMSVVVPDVFSAEKRRAVPMPEAAVEEAMCVSLKISTTDDELESVMEPVRAGIFKSEVVANVEKEPGPLANTPP